MKHKSLIVRQGFYEEEMGSSSVGVERFELPISWSQSMGQDSLTDDIM